MAVKPSEIRWAGYQNLEGPFFPGRIPYVIPANPDFLDKSLQVLAATEGGRYDAINMYDTCILTVGIIQVCEKVFEFSRMLGACTAGLGTLRQAFEKLPIPADIKPSNSVPGRWRFFFLDGRGEVDTPAKMQTLFLGGCSGMKGSWTEDQKQHAKEVAAVMASIWEDPALQTAQREYVKPHILTYVRPRTKDILFTNSDEDGWVGALKAAVISYSANMPANADKLFLAAAADPAWANANDEEKFTLAMRQMAFNSGIGIWPNRYRHISPSLNQLFGVKVPTLEELSGQPLMTESEDPVAIGSDVKTVQQMLIDNGYDLGPAGADGIWGPKSKAAMSAFQAILKVQITGAWDYATASAIAAMSISPV